MTLLILLTLATVVNAKLTITPNKIVTYVGASIQLNCTVDNENHLLYWAKIVDENTADYSNENVFEFLYTRWILETAIQLGNKKNNTNILTLSNVTLEDKGIYVCFDDTKTNNKAFQSVEVSVEPKLTCEHNIKYEGLLVKDICNLGLQPDKNISIICYSLIGYGEWDVPTKHARILTFKFENRYYSRVTIPVLLDLDTLKFKYSIVTESWVSPEIKILYFNSLTEPKIHSSTTKPANCKQLQTNLACTYKWKNVPNNRKEKRTKIVCLARCVIRNKVCKVYTDFVV